MTKGSERNYILKILEDIEKKELFANQILDDYFYVYEFDKKQRSFIQRVVYGVIENRNYIDFCIDSVSKIKVRKMKPVIRHIIRMGTYQILFMDKVPSHAAINEAVKLTGKRRFHQLKGFVNGVLRTIDRNKGSFEEKLSGLDLLERLSVRYTIDSKLVAYLLRQYSDDEVQRFLEESLSERGTCVRTNTLKTTADVLRKDLEKHSEVENGHIFGDSFYLSGYDILTKIPSFTKGEFQVQDESSTIVGHVANPEKDWKVIDVCAAPGGKTTHLAELMQGTGQVFPVTLAKVK